MKNDKSGLFIKELREKNNLSQQQLADKLFVDRTLVNKWEKGKCAITPDNLVALKKVFNVSSDEILMGELKTNNNKKMFDNIVFDMYKKQFRIYKLFRLVYMILVILLIILFFFLIYYFTTFYNSVNVYTIHTESQNLDIENGIMVKTRDKIYLRFELRFNIDTDVIDTIKIYYNKDGKKQLIYNTSDYTSISINDYSDYQEYFDFDIFDYIIDNMYIEYNLTAEHTIRDKLIIDKDYSNSNIFIKNKKGASFSEKKTTKNNVPSSLYNKFLDLYDNMNENTYKIKYNSIDYQLIVFENELILRYKKDINEYNIYYRKYESEFLTKTISGEDIYDYNLVTKKCLYRKCDDVEVDIKLLEAAVDIVLNKEE